MFSIVLDGSDTYRGMELCYFHIGRVIVSGNFMQNIDFYKLIRRTVWQLRVDIWFKALILCRGATLD